MHSRAPVPTLLLALALVPSLAPAAAPAGRGAGGIFAGRGLPGVVTDAARNAADAFGTAPAKAAPDVASAAGKAAQQTTTNATSNQSNSLESNTLLTIINKAFDTDSGDMIDPENGTMRWKGHTYELGQMRIFRSRFERYLALTPTPDQQQYQTLIDQVFARLATNNPNGGSEENMKQAWQLLFQAAEFEADAGTALDVANQVFNTWRIEHEKDAQRIAQTEQERLRDRQQRNVAYDANVTARETRNSAMDATSQAALLNPSSLAPKGSVDGSIDNSGATLTGITVVNGTTETSSSNTSRNGGSGGNRGSGNRNGGYGVNLNQTVSSTIGVGTQLMNASQLVKTEAKIAAIQTSQALTVTAAKVQFQGHIISLFLQRKFQHAIIAAGFYRFIFKGSAQDLDKQFTKTLADFLPGGGDVPFTVGMIENLSREALNEVKQGMAAVRANFGDQQLMAALQRLEEAFFLGEFLGDVSQLEKDKRQKLYALYLKIDSARKLADLKDYEGIIKLNDEIGGLTNDFRSSEVTAAAHAAQQMSRLALAGAKQAASMGDFDHAQSLLEKASGIWPLNPDIAAYGNGVSANASITSQAAVVFDDAYQHKEYRRIYERQQELAVGLATDAQRGLKFKEVIERMGQVELALAQAREAVSRNSPAVAWDMLTVANDLVANDNVVNQLRAEVAPRAADYVALADKAQRAEERGDDATSLSHYLALQDLNPTSPVALNGIERVTTKLLARLADEKNSSVAGKK